MAQTVDDAKRAALVTLYPALSKAPINDLWRQRCMDITGLPAKVGMNTLEREFWKQFASGAGSPTVGTLDDIRAGYLRAAFPIVGKASLDDYLYKYWTS